VKSSISLVHLEKTVFRFVDSISRSSLTVPCWRQPSKILSGIIVISNNSVVFCLCFLSREYWMIYRVPGFLALIRFGSSLTPPPLSKLSLFPRLPMTSGRAYWRKRRGRGWGRSQIYDVRKPGPYKSFCGHTYLISGKFIEYKFSLDWA
jgi:hypothetical protein